MKINIVIYFLLFSIYFISCKDELDLRPTDIVSEEVAFNSVAALQKGLNVAYVNYGVARASTMNANSITSDEVKFGPNNGGQSQFGFRLQYSAEPSTSDEVLEMFYLYYELIDQVNRVLSKIDDVPISGPSDESSKKSIKGQLLALRAMGHFELLQAYSNNFSTTDPLGIPIMVENCLTCQPKRNSILEVVQQIETDLNEAKSLIPTLSGSYNDLTLNQISITAYQARVAIYKGEWQIAENLATTVINSGIKPLVSGTDFQGIWTDQNTNEVLFRSRFENSAIVGSNWTSSNGSIIFSPSDKLTASYSSTDVRRVAYIGSNSTGRYVKKFYQSSRGGSIVDIKGIRTAELYLIRAEARAELNNLTGAADDINFLRSHRITSYTPVVYTDKNAAITDIILERFKELAFEGFRFYDLRRRLLSVQRNTSDVDSPLWQILPVGDYRFVYPISADELLANKNMVQNPGY